MSTTIRATVSYKSPYWISKERYYELKHFCLQYNDYKRKIAEFGLLGGQNETFVKQGKNYSINDKTAKIAVNMAFYEHYIDIIDECLEKAGEDIYIYLHKAVTEGKSYAVLNPPCSKDYFYLRYRAFFWLLDKVR